MKIKEIKDPKVKVEFPNWISEAKFAFELDGSGMDMRLSNPKMNELPSWKKHDNNAQVFNSKALYVLFMYDKNSVFLKKFSDLEIRRQKAIEESGVNAELVTEMTDPHFINMVIDFLKFQNDRLWFIICQNESIFLQYSTILMQNTFDVKGDKDLVQTITLKEKVRENIMKVDADLTMLYEKFYNGDKVLEEKATEVVRFSPESVAKKLK